MIALAALGAITVGASAIAGAATNTATTATRPSQGSSPPMARPDPATMSHGPNETILTDGTADKVKQAALDKVSRASVIRVETDSEGSPYEAHLRKSDGAEVTLTGSNQGIRARITDGIASAPSAGDLPTPEPRLSRGSRLARRS